MHNDVGIAALHNYRAHVGFTFVAILLLFIRELSCPCQVFFFSSDDVPGFWDALFPDDVECNPKENQPMVGLISPNMMFLHIPNCQT